MGIAITAFLFFSCSRARAVRHEENIPAAQEKAEKYARIPGADGDENRPEGACEPPGKGAA